MFLVAATLRPETMYGQTNCWLHPDINYIAFRVKSGKVFVSTRRAALNMAYQDFTAEFGKIEVLLKLKGEVILYRHVSECFVSVVWPSQLSCLSCTASNTQGKMSMNTDFHEVKGVRICTVRTPYSRCKSPRKSVVVPWLSVQTYTACVRCP